MSARCSSCSPEPDSRCSGKAIVLALTSRHVTARDAQCRHGPPVLRMKAHCRTLGLAADREELPRLWQFDGSSNDVARRDKNAEDGPYRKSRTLPGQRKAVALKCVVTLPALSISRKKNGTLCRSVTAPDTHVSELTHCIFGFLIVKSGQVQSFSLGISFTRKKGRRFANTWQVAHRGSC